MSKVMFFYYAAYLYVLYNWYQDCISRTMEEQMDFFGVNGTCYGAHPDILKFVPFGVQFAERYKAFGEFFQKVVCAFIFGFSLYKQKIVYLSNIYIELFLMVLVRMFMHYRNATSLTTVKMMALMLAAIYNAMIVVSRNRNPKEVIMTALNSRDENFVTSCLQKYSDKKFCTELYAYRAVKSKLIAEAFFWVIFLTLMIIWRIVILERRNNRLDAGDEPFEDNDLDPFF